MNTCRFTLTLDGNTFQFDNEIQLDEYLIKKKLFEGFKNDIVYAKSNQCLKAEKIIQEQRDAANRLQKEFTLAIQNAENVDSEIRLNPKPPYIGVTRYLEGRKNRNNELLFPEFRDEVYWNNRLSLWTSPLKPNESIRDRFSEQEIKLLADGNNIDEMYKNFEEQRKNLSGNGQPKMLTQTEAKNLQSSILKKWGDINPEGTAVHFVMQQFFSKLTNPNGEELTDGEGNYYYVFDLEAAPKVINGIQFPSITDFIRNKIETELKTQMGRDKYHSGLITDQMLNQLINFAGNFKDHIRNIIGEGDNLDFYPELKLTSDINTTGDSGKKLMGIIDLAVVDDKGRVHIFDYKCSDKEYGEYTSAKKRTFFYQQATYARILSKHGLNTDDSVIRIVPITFSNFRCENKDMVLTNPDKVKFAFDGIDYNSEYSIDIRKEIDRVDASGTSKVINNIDEFLPKEKITDADSDKALEYVTNAMSKFFPSFTDSRSTDEEEVRKTLEEQGCFEKKSDNLYHYKGSYGKDIVDTDPEGLVQKVLEIREKRAKSKPNLASHVIKALTYGQKNNTTNIQAFIDSINTRHLADKNGIQEWFKNYLSRYCNRDWEVINSETAKLFGIVMIRNKITNQVDVIKLTTSNPKYIKSTKDGNVLLTRNFKSDSVEQTIQDSKMLEDANGNRELIEAALFLNQMPGMFSGSYNTAVVGNMIVINPYTGQGVDASNEQILYSLNRLKEYAPLEGDDNIQSGVIKFGTRWQLLKNQLAELISNQSPYKLNQQDVYNKCSNQIQEMAEDNVNVQSKINLLTTIIKQLEKDYNIKQLTETQINAGTLDSEIYRFYYNCLIEIGELQGFQYKQQLKESAKWLEGGLSINSFLNTGIHGTQTDNPGNLISNILNSITKVHKIALQGVRDDARDIVSKTRMHLERLKKEKNYGYLTSTVQNDTQLYNNMFELTPDGDFRFKYINDLHGEEKKFLEFALDVINKDRWNYTDSELERMKQNNDIRYYRVPLCMASRTNQRNAGVKKKINEEGQFEDYQISLWNSVKETFKALSPKNALKELRAKFEGAFDSSNNYEAAEQLYQLNTIFDSTEPDSDGTNLQHRLDIIKQYGTAYFEQNLEDLLFKHMVTYSTKKHIDQIMPTVKAGMAYLINMGATQNTKFVNDVEYYEDYLRSRIKNQPLENDPMLGNSDTAKGVRETSSRIRQAASFMALAFRPVQWIGQKLQGLWNDISLIIRKPDGTQAFTFKNMKDAFVEVEKEMMHFSDDPTKLQLMNEWMGVNDMDMNLYAQKLRTDKHGFNNLNEIAMKFVSRPDFYNRWTIIVAKMKHEGTYDAFTVKDKKLVYDFKKDARFSLYSKGDKSNLEEYHKQEALYIAIAEQFIREGATNPDGSKFQFGQPLPMAYTSQDIESMKNLTDTIYGYYTHENKSLIHASFLGSLFMQMRTYWTSKKNQYFQKGGVKIQGKWEQMTDANGNPLFYQTDEDGNLDRSVPPVTEDQLKNKQMKIPFTQWKGLWEEGIVLTIGKTFRALYNDDEVEWNNPYTWVTGYNKFMSNLDPNMRLRYKQNIKQLWIDLLATLLLGSLLGGLFTSLNKDMIKRAKDSGEFSDAALAALTNNLTKSWTYAASDFNAANSIGSVVTDWNPFAITTVTNLASSVGSVAFGDKSFYNAAVNSFTAAKEMKPIFTYLAPDGGYIIPQEEE